MQIEARRSFDCRFGRGFEIAAAVRRTRSKKGFENGLEHDHPGCGRPALCRGFGGSDSAPAYQGQVTPRTDVGRQQVLMGPER